MLCLLRQRLFEQFAAEELPVDKTAAQRTQHLVPAGDPRLDGGQHIRVVQQRVLVERLTLHREVIESDMVVEEIMQRRRAE